MVQSIRTVEESLGDGIKRVTESESHNCYAARKSFVASREIRAGELYRVKFNCQASGKWHFSMQWDAWIGRRASRDFAVDELIS